MRLLILDALYQAGVESWPEYGVALNNYRNDKKLSPTLELSDLDILEALRRQGVSKWSGYSLALDLLEVLEMNELAADGVNPSLLDDFADLQL